MRLHWQMLTCSAPWPFEALRLDPPSPEHNTTGAQSPSQPHKQASIWPDKLIEHNTTGAQSPPQPCKQAPTWLDKLNQSLTSKLTQCQTQTCVTFPQQHTLQYSRTQYCWSVPAVRSADPQGPPVDAASVLSMHAVRREVVVAGPW